MSDYKNIVDEETDRDVKWFGLSALAIFAVLAAITILQGCVR